MIKKYIFVFCLILSGIMPAFSHNNLNPLLLSKIEQFKKSQQLPAISLLIADQNQVILSAQLGSLSSKINIPVTQHSQFRIGSISKLISAVLLLRLYQEHKIESLHESIYSVIKPILGDQTPDYLRQITLDNLLTHTSGIRHYDPNRYEQEKQFNGEILSRKDALLMNNALLQTPQFKPGKSYLYSTYAINMLQDAIEQATKTSFQQSLNKYLTQTYELRDTSIDNGTNQFYQQETSHILINEHLLLAPAVNPSWKTVGGGLISSTHDLIQLIRALTSHQILNNNTYNLMTTINPYQIENVDYGRGVHVFSKKNITWLGHGGSATGATGYVFFRKDGHLMLTALTNVSIKSKILGKLLNHLAQLIDKETPLYFN